MQHFYMSTRSTQFVFCTFDIQSGNREKRLFIFYTAPNSSFPQNVSATTYLQTLFWRNLLATTSFQPTLCHRLHHPRRGVAFMEKVFAGSPQRAHFPGKFCASKLAKACFRKDLLCGIATCHATYFKPFHGTYLKVLFKPTCMSF